MKNKKIILIVLGIIAFVVFAIYKISAHVSKVNGAGDTLRQLQQAASRPAGDQ